MLQNTSDVHHTFTSLNAGPEALDIKRVSAVECHFLSLEGYLEAENKDWNRNSAIMSTTLTRDSRHVKLSLRSVGTKKKM